MTTSRGGRANPGSRLVNRVNGFLRIAGMNRKAKAMVAGVLRTSSHRTAVGGYPEDFPTGASVPSGASPEPQRQVPFILSGL